MLRRVAVTLLAATVTQAAHAQESSEAALAKKLANPIANLISVPLQSNWDCCFGPNDVGRYTLNVQPVLPISLSPKWNLISRTIVPYVVQDSPAPGAGDTSGFGDVLQSLFFSPSEPVNGVTWGVGPVVQLPFGTDHLSTHSWGLGPTAVVLRQSGRTTLGFLTNHVWSVDGRSDLSVTLLQPFFTYTWPSSTAFTVNSESTYDWKAQQWTAPINVGVTHVYRFGRQRVQLGLYGRYYLDRPPGGPDWGARMNVTFLFPK